MGVDTAGFALRDTTAPHYSSSTAPASSSRCTSAPPRPWGPFGEGALSEAEALASADTDAFGVY
jgi:hypothetical protein